MSVVVPIYNGREHLAETVESVLAQSYRNWEAVLVDDASSDGSYELAADYAERSPERLKAIRLERNVGVVGARNAAIQASGGELVALLDHDDYWHESYLERLVGLYDGATETERRVGIVSCDALIHGPHGLTGERLSEIFAWTDQVDYDAMIRHNYVFARALFARRAYDEVGGFAAETAGSDDYDLWLRMIEAGYAVLAVREPLAVYRYHPGGLSRDRVLMSEAKLVVYRRALGRGFLTDRQRRIVKRRMRHFRAVRAQALLREAATARRPLRSVSAAARAAPLAVVAFVEQPGEWLRALARLLRRLRARARGV